MYPERCRNRVCCKPDCRRNPKTSRIKQMEKTNAIYNKKSNRTGSYESTGDIWNCTKFHERQGNLTQWGKGDEPENLTEDDIRQGNLYALTDNAGEIHAVFVFMIGEDPGHI